MRAFGRLVLIAALVGAPLACLLSPGWPPPLAWFLLLAGLGLLFLSAALVLALRWVNPPTTAFMLRERAALRRKTPGAELSYTWVNAAGLAPELRLAAIVSEDTYFAFHAGFDWDSLRAAREHNKTAARKRGGSTITQQLAKNLFLWERGTYLRKAIEAYFTLLIEAAWPKRRILEVYLNIAHFGPATFGAEAAAQKFLGKPARDLTRQEAALLVAVLPGPRLLYVAQPSHQVRFRQAMILNRMKRVGLAHLDLLEAPRARPRPAHTDRPTA